MADKFNFPDNYRIEVSGWGLDNAFFVEKTDLLWSQSGEKQVLLHRALPEGAVVFVRLLGPESMIGSVPVAYQVESVRPMDCTGVCEVRLIPVHPRLKVSSMSISASHSREDEMSKREPRRCSVQPEPEEILQ